MRAIFLCTVFPLVATGCLAGKIYRIALSDVPKRANIIVFSPTTVKDHSNEPRYARPFLVHKQLPEQWQRFTDKLAKRWDGRARSVLLVPATNPLVLSLPVSALVGVDRPVKLDTGELQRLLRDAPADLVIVPYYHVQDHVRGWLFIKNTNKYCPNQNYSSVILNFLILDGRGNILARGVDFYHFSDSVLLNEVRTDGGFITTMCGSASKLEVDYTRVFERLYSMEDLVR